MFLNIDALEGLITGFVIASAIWSIRKRFLLRYWRNEVADKERALRLARGHPKKILIIENGQARVAYEADTIDIATGEPIRQ